MAAPKLIKLTRKNKRGKWYGLFVCQCGSKFEALKYSVSSSHTKSCGCLTREHCSRMGKEQAKNNIKHGLYKTGIYRSWADMKHRCYNEANPFYSRYGGRGIKVCDSWKDSFLNFAIDMYETWWPGASLDRIDNNGNYEPDNCQWLTKSANSSKSKGS